MELLQKIGPYEFRKYDEDYYAVDYNTPSVGKSIVFSKNKEEVKAKFVELTTNYETAVKLPKQEIIKKVALAYDCVLEGDFNVYDNMFELYRSHFLDKSNVEDVIDTLKNFIVEGADLKQVLLDEQNVFQVDDKWIYAEEWHDVEWDD